MFRLRFWGAVFVLVGTAGLLSCFDTVRGEDAAERLENLQGKACECANRDCANKVFAEVKGLVPHIYANADDGTVIVSRVSNAFSKIGGCLRRQGIPRRDYDALKSLVGSEV